MTPETIQVGSDSRSQEALSQLFLEPEGVTGMEVRFDLNEVRVREGLAEYVRERLQALGARITEGNETPRSHPLASLVRPLRRLRTPVIQHPVIC